MNSILDVVFRTILLVWAIYCFTQTGYHLIEAVRKGESYKNEMTWFGVALYFLIGVALVTA